MLATAIPRALLLVGVALTAQLCACTAYVGGDGFSVEFIHRDSVGSPFYDPSLTAHSRVLKALARSHASAAVQSAGGVVSELTSTPFEYMMALNVGTPPTRMIAIADTGSDLVWIKCSKGAKGPGPAFAGDAPSPPLPPAVVFDASKSKTYRLVGCDSGACRELEVASCDDNKCTYSYDYGDGSSTSGVLSTETFTFADARGGARTTTRVPNVNFGCSTSFDGSFIGTGDGLVGLGNSNLSLVTQLGADTSLGRRFSYCLVPYSNNGSSVLNFGARATVTDPGAATTPLVPSEVKAYYTIDLLSVKVGSATYTAAAADRTPAIVDSGTTLTYLDTALLDPLVKELGRRIKFPRAEPPKELKNTPLCFNVTGLREEQIVAKIPDVELGLGGGAAVTLKPLNTFVVVQEGTLCLALVPASEDLPASIIGNIAQQNMHVGYDLDKQTVTFAPADCGRSYPAPAHAPGPAHAHAPAPAPSADSAV